jgi:hypothetical protein
VKCSVHGCEMRPLFTSVYCAECDLEGSDSARLMRRKMFSELASYRKFGITEYAVTRIKA